MKRKIKFLVYPIAVILMSLFVVGCSDDEDEVLPDEDTPGKVTDVDGNEYATVIIGDQEWMAENLRVTRYNNGDTIPTLSNEDWGDTTEGAYAIYPHEGGYTEDDVEGINSDAEMVAVYGKLYNGYAVDDSRGLCPEGWHVPSDAEWTELTDYLGDNASGKLKATGTIEAGTGLWYAPNTGATNETGFTALPAGGAARNGSFYYIGYHVYFWSATENRTDLNWYRYLNYYESYVTKTYTYKGWGLSVRCIKD